MLIHVVRSGDTVSSIARQYGVDPQRLSADNAVPPSGALAVGQTLVVQFPQVIHTVQPGETLTSIARQYGVTLRRLWQNNFPLGGGESLQPGDSVVISYFGEKLGSTVVNGYAYPFISASLLAEESPYLTYLTPFTYGITPEGRLLELNDQAIIDLARSRGAWPILHLSTYTEEDRFDTQRAMLVLSDPAVQDRLVEDILEMIRRKDFAGLDVDFEYLTADLATPYADFLARMRRELAPQGRFVWAALAPKTSASQRGLLYEGHSYAQIGAATDAVLLMTYEWGYTYGPPMAVAPLPNVRAVLDYAVTEIPREKILLGIPNYGYDWPLPFVQGETRANSLSNQEAILRAIRYGAEIRYDERAQSPWYRYTDEEGRSHEVWFEDARSMEAKLRLLAEYGFQGAGYWNIMRPFPQTWLVLAALYDIL